MTRMSGNDEISSRDFVDSSQLTGWILNSGTTCHMTLQVSYIIPGLLEYTDGYIGVADGHHATANQKVQVQIKICDNNGDISPPTLHNILLAPDICNGLLSIITLMNSGKNLFISKRVLHVVIWL